MCSPCTLRSRFWRRARRIFCAAPCSFLETHRETAVFDSGDVAAVIVSLGVLLLSFSNVTVSHISVGRVLIVLTVLVCARVGGLAGGAVAGIAAGTVQGALHGGAFVFIRRIRPRRADGRRVLATRQIRRGGGVRHFKRHRILAGEQHFAGVLRRGGGGRGFHFIHDFAAEPTAFNLFTAHGDRLPGDSLRKNVILRLRYTAEAMRSASDSVDRISEKLETTAAADLPHVYGRAAEKVCTGCSQCAVCWRKNRDETQKRSRGFRIRCGSAAKSNAATLMCRFDALQPCHGAERRRKRRIPRAFWQKKAPVCVPNRCAPSSKNISAPRRRCSATWRRNSSSTSALMRIVQSRCARSCATANSRRLKSAAASINSAA